MAVDKRAAFSIQLLQLIDAGIVLLSLWGAGTLWNIGLGHWFAEHGYRVSERGSDWRAFVDVIFLSVPFIPLILEMLGFYRSPGKSRIHLAIWRLFQGHLLMLCCLGLVVLTFHIPLHRPTVGMGLVASFFLIATREIAVGAVYRAGVQSKSFTTDLLLAGHPASCHRWWDELGEEQQEQYELDGIFDLSASPLADLRSLLKDKPVERVVFLVEDCPFDKVTAAIEECEIQGVEVWLSADFVRARIAQPSFDSFGGLPMLVLRSTPTLSWSLLTKALIDRVGAFILLLIFAIPMMIAALGIKLSDRGPVFFRQKRAGRYGKAFEIWKFRTMYVDAEERLREVKDQVGNQMSGPVFKLNEDPRVFSFGAFLRRTSLDELPQFFNVLMGDMSLVGPRPLPLYEVEEIRESSHRRRLSVKPGITCIWQVSGRNEITDFNEWVKLDLRYIDNWSLWLDIRILFKTVPAVLLSRGAK